MSGHVTLLWTRVVCGSVPSPAAMDPAVAWSPRDELNICRSVISRLLCAVELQGERLVPGQRIELMLGFFVGEVPSPEGEPGRRLPAVESNHNNAVNSRALCR